MFAQGSIDTTPLGIIEKMIVQTFFINRYKNYGDMELKV